MKEGHNDQANTELEARFMNNDTVGGAGLSLILHYSVLSAIEFQVYDLGLEKISLCCITSR